MQNETPYVAVSDNGQNGFKKLAIGIAYCGAVTVMPFMRVPGTAGAQFFRFWSAMIGSALMYLFLYLTDELHGCPICIGCISLLSVVATIAQIVAGKLKLAGDVSAPPKHIGKSIYQLFAPDLPERGVVMCGEAIVLNVVGIALWFVGLPSVTGWLLFASICNAWYYHWSFPQIEWVKPRPIARAGSHAVKQIPCRVLARTSKSITK